MYRYIHFIHFIERVRVREIKYIYLIINKILEVLEEESGNRGSWQTGVEFFGGVCVFV